MIQVMSNLLSRFRAKLSTKEQLESIENELQNIEDYKWSKLRQQKNLAALVILISILGYFILAVVFYFYFLPKSSSFYDLVVHSIPLIAFPAIAYSLQRILQWYYRWIIDNNEDRIKELRKQKRRILDKVMETETYKVAKELLEKFDPLSLKSADSPPRSSAISSSSSQQLSPTNLNQSLRQRPSTVTPLNTPAAGRPNVSGSPMARPAFQQPPATFPSSFNPNQMQFNAPSSGQLRQGGAGGSYSPRPIRPARPVLPAERTVFDRMIDFMVGDGPSNRYALVCCSCHGHNGMALKDEFEYLAFRCCYCNSYNPPRKLRPLAPRIEPQSSSSNSEQPVIRQQESESENADLKSTSATAASTLTSSTSNVSVNNTNDSSTACEKTGGEISSSGEDDEEQRGAEAHVISTEEVENNDKCLPVTKSDDDNETTHP